MRYLMIMSTLALVAMGMTAYASSAGGPRVTYGPKIPKELYRFLGKPPEDGRGYRHAEHFKEASKQRYLQIAFTLKLFPAGTNPALLRSTRNRDRPYLGYLARTSSGVSLAFFDGSGDFLYRNEKGKYTLRERSKERSRVLMRLPDLTWLDDIVNSLFRADGRRRVRPELLRTREEAVTRVEAMGHSSFSVSSLCDWNSLYPAGDEGSVYVCEYQRGVLARSSSDPNPDRNPVFEFGIPAVYFVNPTLVARMSNFRVVALTEDQYRERQFMYGIP